MRRLLLVLVLSFVAAASASFGIVARSIAAVPEDADRQQSCVSSIILTTSDSQPDTPGLYRLHCKIEHSGRGPILGTWYYNDQASNQTCSHDDLEGVWEFDTTLDTRHEPFQEGLNTVQLFLEEPNRTDSNLMIFTVKRVPEAADTSPPVEERIRYGAFLKVRRWSDSPLPQPHRLDPLLPATIPFAMPIQPTSSSTTAANWAGAKVYEAEEAFTVHNLSDRSQDVFFDVLVYPTTPWQETTILSSALPIRECFYDRDGNAWVRVRAGNMRPGEQRWESLRMKMIVARLSMKNAQKLETPVGTDYPPAVARFLSDQSSSEAKMNWSGTPELTEAAQKITGAKKSTFDKALAIYTWMRKNVRYGSTGHGSGHSALVRRRAPCGGQARLFVGLCRSAGVPAREIDGRNAYHKDGSITSHAWAEFYVPGYGWVPVDTSTSRFASSSQWHVGKTVAFGRYFRNICIPGWGEIGDYYDSGGILVATADGEIGREGEWGLADLRADIRLTGTFGLTVREAQQKLLALGYNPGPLDGIWGSKTSAAVEQFQRDRHLPQTGRLDKQTMSLLSAQ